MRTIALISQKGGAGKTTAAINLAVAAERAKRPAVVIDLDPQASASAWGDSREQANPVVTSIQAARLNATLETARAHQAKLALIDTAPHAESPALAAARAADLVLIPCRPSVLDLRAISASRDLAQLAGTPAVAVLCAVPARGPLTGEAEAAIGATGLSVAPMRIGHRMAYVHAITAGEGVIEHAPKSKAAVEIDKLFRWAWKEAKS